MASFEVGGIQQAEAMLNELASIPDDYAETLLFDGGEILARHIRTEAMRAGHVDTGSMVKGIKLKRKVVIDKDGVKYVTISAVGSSRRKDKSMGNAQKAFWANYGTSKQPGTRFWDKGEQAAEKEMQQVFDNKMDQIYIQKGIK